MLLIQYLPFKKKPMPTTRRDFMRITGLAGAASLWPFGKLSAQTSGGCVLIPTETKGPFPLDLTDNPFYLRTDVREDRDGVQLNLKIRILGQDNCEPFPNVRVNIWQCDKDGNYSGYGSESAFTYLRGYQIADANGEVNFITIFPGWYPGRTCHIHFQVYVNSSYAAISQLTWNHEEKNALLNDYPAIYTEGFDPVTPVADGVFADGYLYQLASLTADISPDKFNSYIEVTVKGDGTTGYLEMQSEKYISVGQNMPNPVNTSTVIPFQLQTPAEIDLEIWNINGQKIFTLPQGIIQAGKNNIELTEIVQQLQPGNYIYQLKIKSNKIICSPPMVMTVI